MTNQSTIDKLIEMRLTAMADAFRNQTDDPRLKEVPFDRIQQPQEQPFKEADPECRIRPA